MSNKPAFDPPMEFVRNGSTWRVSMKGTDGTLPPARAEWVDKSEYLDPATRAIIEAFVLAQRDGWPAHPSAARDVADILEQLLAGGEPNKAFKMTLSGRGAMPKSLAMVAQFEIERPTCRNDKEAYARVAKHFHRSEATVRSHIEKYRIKDA